MSPKYTALDGRVTLDVEDYQTLTEKVEDIEDINSYHRIKTVEREILIFQHSEDENTYNIDIQQNAKVFLDNLNEASAAQIKDACLKLAAEPRPSGFQKLNGTGAWKIKVADCRIIYEIDDVERWITIIRINDSSNLYRKA